MVKQLSPGKYMKDKIKAFIGNFSKSQKKTESKLSESNKSKSSNEDWLEDGYSWLPRWKEIIGEDWDDWLKRIEEAKGGPKVLIATTIGGNSALAPLEGLFGLALTLRGAEVHYLLCDKSLPACQNAYGTDDEAQKKFLENGPALCDWCYDCGSKNLGPLGLPVHNVSTLLSKEERAEAKNVSQQIEFDKIKNLEHGGINLGESINSGALRFFGRGDFEGEDLAEPVVRKFLEGALLTYNVLEKLHTEYKFEHTIVNQGFYVPHGVAVDMANKHGSHLVVWDLAYKKCCMTISHNNTYFRIHKDDSLDEWNKQDFSEEQEAEIVEYLTSRWSGKNDWRKFLESGETVEPKEIFEELGIDPDKPTIGLLTNVVWDAQVFYPGNAFENMMDWLITTIKHFQERPDLQLLIRVHPAEEKSWQRSRQFVVDEIKKVFPEIPDNVFIIPSKSKINTYKAMMGCDSVLIYATTAGLELLCLGLPVIVAGQAWMRNKGVSIDVKSKEHYQELLEGLPFGKKLSAKELSAARKYAYHYYLRKMIELGVTEHQPYENAPYKIPNLGLKGFEKGQDVGLDVICDGILENEPFVFPMETLKKSAINS